MRCWWQYISLEWQDVFKCLSFCLCISTFGKKRFQSIITRYFLRSPSPNCKNWENWELGNRAKENWTAYLVKWFSVEKFEKQMQSKCEVSKLSSVLFIAVSFIYILITECCIWWFASNFGVSVTFVEACLVFQLKKIQLLSLIVLAKNSAVQHENIEFLEERLSSVKSFQIWFLSLIDACLRGSTTAFSVS